VFEKGASISEVPLVVLLRRRCSREGFCVEEWANTDGEIILRAGFSSDFNAGSLDRIKALLERASNG
jgi:hypothetical protein